VSYAFLFSTCFLYANRIAPPAVGNSVQSVYNFVFYGLGPIAAVFLNAFLARTYAGPGAVLGLAGFSHLWYTLGAVSILMLAVVIALFHPDREPPREASAPALPEAEKST